MKLRTGGIVKALSGADLSVIGQEHRNQNDAAREEYYKQLAVQ